MKTIGQISMELEKRGYYACIERRKGSEGWVINLGGVSKREFASISAEYPNTTFINK
jgi:hypothetical protein